jgi:hypothetical protein|tara:strand:- start:6662 stop:7126 length:465 start_codon:yes stop_codon:yes gene_type:complete
MVSVVFIEHLAEALCGISAVLFTFIATFSRSPRAENIVQNLIAIILITAAGVLWWLSLSGGELWGSNYLPKPLSLVCIVIAISARMNIKGENISFGANPHTIGKENHELENINSIEQSSSTENTETKTVINIQEISINDSVVTETTFSNSSKDD